MGSPKPMTRTRQNPHPSRRYGFPRVRVRVALENPRVARDNPYPPHDTPPRDHHHTTPRHTDKRNPRPPPHDANAQSDDANKTTTTGRKQGERDRTHRGWPGRARTAKRNNSGAYKVRPLFFHSFFYFTNVFSTHNPPPPSRTRKTRKTRTTPPSTT